MNDIWWGYNYSIWFKSFCLSPLCCVSGVYGLPPPQKHHNNKCISFVFTILLRQNQSTLNLGYWKHLWVRVFATKHTISVCICEFVLYCVEQPGNGLWQLLNVPIMLHRYKAETCGPAAIIQSTVAAYRPGDNVWRGAERAWQHRHPRTIKIHSRSTVGMSWHCCWVCSS